MSELEGSKRYMCRFAAFGTSTGTPEAGPDLPGSRPNTDLVEPEEEPIVDPNGFPIETRPGLDGKGKPIQRQEKGPRPKLNIPLQGARF